MSLRRPPWSRRSFAGSATRAGRSREGRGRERPVLAGAPGGPVDLRWRRRRPRAPASREQRASRPAAPDSSLAREPPAQAPYRARRPSLSRRRRLVYAGGVLRQVIAADRPGAGAAAAADGAELARAAAPL